MLMDTQFKVDAQRVVKKNGITNGVLMRINRAETNTPLYEKVEF